MLCLVLLPVTYLGDVTLIDHKHHANQDEKETAEKLYDFYSEEYAIITFKLPAIHCSSCIWLLEKLERLIPGIERSTVNFLKKQLTICFNPQEIKLSNIANKLNSLGYEPELSLAGTGESSKKDNRQLIWKLAIAGFCFRRVSRWIYKRSMSC